jgi:hypothetical protein
MKKKIVISTSITAFVLIALIAIGLYSLEVRQQYGYSVTYKPTEQSKKVIHVLQQKMKEAGYGRKQHKYILGTQKFFSFSEANSIDKCYMFNFVYGYTGSFWSIPEQKKEFLKICNEVIDPVVSKLEVVSRHGKGNAVAYEQGKRYIIFWCIEFD